MEDNTDCEGLEVMAAVAVSQANEAAEEVNGNTKRPDLLNAFKHGIEQSLALVQQMSAEDKAAALKTLTSLFGGSNLLVANLFQDQTLTSVVESEVKDGAAAVEASNENNPPETGETGVINILTEQRTRSSETSRPTRPKSQRLMARKSNTKANSKPPLKRKRKTSPKKERKPVEFEKTPQVEDKSDGESDAKSEGSTDPLDPNENSSSNGNKVFSCDICNRKLKSRFSLLVHKRIHTGEKPYSCHLCDKTFSCSNNCRRHIRETHEGARPFNCTHCSTGFFRQLQLEKHLVEDHNMNSSQVKEELEKNVTKKEFSVYDCKECGKHFKTKSNLRVHEAVHMEERQYECPQCDKKFSFRTNLKRHMMLHTGVRPHQCDMCDKGFIEFKSLKLHMSKEHGGPEIKEPDKFTCEECGKQLSSRTSLHNHKLTHSGSKPHICPHCSKAFSMKSNLQRHIRGHSNDKPWECPTCSKRFTEKKSMEVHFRIHTGERPYTCEECGKCFAQASTLHAHKPVHNKERAISCEVCGKSFLRKSHYRFHIAKHTNPPKHKCVDCPRAFYRKADLNRHQLTHTGERPYHCTFCPKQFSRQLYLKDHLNTHLGQRPYTCSHCPATYAESSARVKHMRRCPMRVTSKPDIMVTETPQQILEQIEDVEQPDQTVVTDGNIVVSAADLDIVTTAMNSAALSPLTIMHDGLIVDGSEITANIEEQQITTSADNLVALANGGVITLQGTTINLAGLTADREQLEIANTPLTTDSVTTFEHLGLQTIHGNEVKEVHVQDVDTGTGKTKHYIVVIPPGTLTQ